MFGRAIWYKLPESIFEKNRLNQTCEYWLMTPNQQTLCIETNIFSQRAITNQRVGRHKITPLTVQNEISNSGFCEKQVGIGAT